MFISSKMTPINAERERAKQEAAEKRKQLVKTINGKQGKPIWFSINNDAECSNTK